LVPIPYLSLNTDTFDLSGESVSVLVSCAPPTSLLGAANSRPPGRQTELCEEMILDVLTSLCHMGPDLPRKWKFRNSESAEKLHGKLRAPTSPSNSKLDPASKVNLVILNKSLNFSGSQVVSL
jgi:hypothetical protein